MPSGALYSENDPYKAAVLREAIRAGAIAPGVVDARSITEISPSELRGYAQVHCFAGGGFWSLALRQAGWPDDRPCWTGSCPCPSFSAAGKQLGFRDPRHLWPAWFRLIKVCRPPAIFGEQVANAINHGWLDLVSTDLEGEGYAVGSVVLGAHSVGAPHIRQRLWFVAESEHSQWRSEFEEYRHAYGRDGLGRSSVDDSLDHSSSPRHNWPVEGTEGIAWDQARLRGLGGGCEPVLVVDADHEGSQGHGLLGQCAGEQVAGEGSSAGELASSNEWNSGDRNLQRSGEQRLVEEDGCAVELAQSLHSERRQISIDGCDGPDGQDNRREETHSESRTCGEVLRTNPLNGFWSRADWIGCRDHKFRPVKPGTFPLVNGYPGRVGLLRLAGDAIVVEAARTFIEEYMRIER